MKTSKIRAASFNNRKKILEVNYTSGKSAKVHYHQLGIAKNIVEVWVDKETNGLSLGLRFEDATVDYMRYDQPLALVRDPEYLLQNDIERLIANIKNVIAKKKISKRYLAEQLMTSDNQVQRLLNPTILNKNLGQLYKIATLLGLEFEWHIKEAI